METEDLLLISLGGAAASIVRRMAERATTPLRALILDTDDATLQSITPAVGVSTSVFGAKRLSGRGTGGSHSLGAGAFRDDATQILAQVGTPRLAILLTCCGGGTAGAATTLLEALRTKGIATLVFAVAPFSFEGDDRKRAANVLLPIMETRADALTRISLDALVGEEAATLPAAEAFAHAADRLSAGLGLLWTLVAHPGFIAFDAEHFRAFLTHDVEGGLPFCFADVTVSGENRAQAALNALREDPRFRVNGVDRLANAAQLIVGILAGPDLRLCEIGTVMEGLRAHCQSLKETLLGTADEEAREGSLSVVLFAFGHPLTNVSAAKDGEAPRPLSKRQRGAKTAGTKVLGTAKNRFTDVAPTIYGGQNLDEPTYQRRGIRLTR